MSDARESSRVDGPEGKWLHVAAKAPTPSAKAMEVEAVASPARPPLDRKPDELDMALNRLESRLESKLHSMLSHQQHKLEEKLQALSVAIERTSPSGSPASKTTAAERLSSEPRSYASRRIAFP